MRSAIEFRRNFLVFGKIKHFSSFHIYLLLLTFYLLLCPAAFAQKDDEIPADAAPPPIRKLSQDETKSLAAETSIKKRTQLSLDLMEARIVKSEKLVAESNFVETLNELGGFQGLLDNAMSYLFRNDNGRIDKNFKNVEIYLRKQVPRLEAIRREMPFKYAYYVQRLMKEVREARAKAIEPLFDDTVVPNKP